MKHSATRAWIALFTIGVVALALPDRAAAQAAAGQEILTNESVVQMVVGKVPKDVMLTKIRSTSTAFDITANGLVSLFQRKVSTDLLKAMMVAAAGNPNNSETLDNPAVLYMVSNGLPRDIIIAKIQSAKPGYDLTTSGLVSLNLNKVPPAVLKAMMASNSAGPATPASAAGPAPPTAPPQSTAPPTPSPANVSPPTNAGQTTAPATGGAGSTANQKKAPEKKAPAEKKK